MALGGHTATACLVPRLSQLELSMLGCEAAPGWPAEWLFCLDNFGASDLADNTQSNSEKFDFIAANAAAIMLHWCCIAPTLLQVSISCKRVGLFRGWRTPWQSSVAFFIAIFCSNISRASSFPTCLTRLPFNLSTNCMKGSPGALPYTGKLMLGLTRIRDS